MKAIVTRLTPELVAAHTRAGYWPNSTFSTTLTRVAAARPEEVQAFGERVRRAGELEHDVGAAPVRELAHTGQPRFGRRQLLDRDDGRGAPLLG